MKAEILKINLLSSIRRKFLRWLSPPLNLGIITVQDVWNSENVGKHFELCESWADATWSAWKEHHNRIKEWVESYIDQESYSFLKKLPITQSHKMRFYSALLGGKCNKKCVYLQVVGQAN